MSGALAQHLAAIVESSDDAIISKNLSGIIQSWNSGAERLFGYTAGEAVGEHISMLAPDERKDEIPKILDRISRGQRVDHFETERKTRDGRIIAVSLTVSPIRDATGTVIGASKIARDITQRLQSERVARDAAQQRLLLKRVFVAQEEERQRIARELHDEAGQLLTSLLVGLRRLDSSRSLSASKAIGRQLKEITSCALDELGRLARGLHPAALTDHGLQTAVSGYVAEYSNKHGIRVRLTADGLDSISLPESLQIALYRIIQEALTNIVRHARATKVDVSLKHSSDSLEVAISDNGCGFDVTTLEEFSKNHLGLRSIRERSALFGGVASFCSGNTGTRVSVQIPLQDGQLFHDANPEGQPVPRGEPGP